MAQKKSKLGGFPSGAWTGACFGLAAASLVIGFSTSVFPKPLVFAFISALLAGALLVGGVLGFTLFRGMVKNKRRKTRR